MERGNWRGANLRRRPAGLSAAAGGEKCLRHVVAGPRWARFGGAGSSARASWRPLCGEPSSWPAGPPGWSPLSRPRVVLEHCHRPTRDGKTSSACSLARARFSAIGALNGMAPRRSFKEMPHFPRRTAIGRSPRPFGAELYAARNKQRLQLCPPPPWPLGPGCGPTSRPC